MHNRIKYLDITKFIGIFCIYLGHFGSYAGNAYNFVFSFHVPLFFFVSGFSENLSKDIPFGKYIIKNIKSILLPFYIFATLSLMVVTIESNTHTLIGPNLIEILKGCIRNQYFAVGLWFLTCLFVIKNVFYFLRKTVKFRWLTLLLCIALYCFAELLINPRPIVTPHMIYNIDSACYYIIFYALGYYGFEPIQRLLDWENPINKKISIGIGAILFGYASMLFFEKDFLARLCTNTVMDLLYPVLRAILVILLIFIVSKELEKVELFSSLGKNTLFLCGSEQLIKLLVPLCFQIIGLSTAIPNPLATYIYTFFLLILCNKTLVPLEKALFKELHLMK